MTVELCDLYLKSAERRIEASTLAMDRSRIETHVKPLIGRLTVRSLTAADIERMMGQIIAGKTAKPRAQTGRCGKANGGPDVAARHRRYAGDSPAICREHTPPHHGKPGAGREKAR
jgi:hypothetical protein